MCRKRTLYLWRVNHLTAFPEALLNRSASPKKKGARNLANPENCPLGAPIPRLAILSCSVPTPYQGTSFFNPFFFLLLDSAGLLPSAGAAVLSVFVASVLVLAAASVAGVEAGVPSAAGGTASPGAGATAVDPDSAPFAPGAVASAG